MGLKLSIGTQPHTSPLFVGKTLGNAVLPVRVWLRCGGEVTHRWQRNSSPGEQLRISITQGRRRSSGLPLASLAPFPAPSTLGFPRMLPAPAGS